MASSSDPLMQIKALAADAMKAFETSSARRIGALTAAKPAKGSSAAEQTAALESISNQLRETKALAKSLQTRERAAAAEEASALRSSVRTITDQALTSLTKPKVRSRKAAEEDGGGGGSDLDGSDDEAPAAAKRPRS
jgi:hypothetical protein